MNSKVKISYEELPTDDPQRRRPDITKAKSILGWEPKTSFKDLVKIMVDADRKLLINNPTTNS